MSALPTLSVDQPYASLIVSGVKTIETRPAPLNGDMRPEGVRGLPGVTVNRGDRIGIAATKSQRALAGWAVWPRDCAPGEGPDGWGWHRFDGDGRIVETLPLPLGCLLGTVQVVDAVPMDDAPPHSDFVSCIEVGTDLTLWTPGDDCRIDDQRPLGDFRPGRWGILLADPEPLPDPVPVVGKQGVWRCEL